MNDPDPQNVPPPPLPSGCSIYQVSKIILKTSKGPLCNFCYEICENAESEIISKTFQSSETCSCNHIGNLSLCIFVYFPIFHYFFPSFFFNFTSFFLIFLHFSSFFLIFRHFSSFFVFVHHFHHFSSFFLIFSHFQLDFS